MIAKELMIDDWVNVTQNPIKVDTVYHHTICDIYGNYYSDEEISPIPLTEEILKANGFIKGDIDFGFRRMTDKSYIIDIENLEKGILGKECQYVHEVQQSLRLCGLKDFADDFKLE